MGEEEEEEDEIVVTSIRKKKKEKKVNKTEKKKKVKTLDKKAIDTNSSSSTNDDLTSESDRSSSNSFRQSLPNTPIVNTPTIINDFTPEAISTTSSFIQTRNIKEKPVNDLLVNDFSSPSAQSIILEPKEFSHEKVQNQQIVNHKYVEETKIIPEENIEYISQNEIKEQNSSILKCTDQAIDQKTSDTTKDQIEDLLYNIENEHSLEEKETVSIISPEIESTDEEFKNQKEMIKVESLENQTIPVISEVHSHEVHTESTIETHQETPIIIHSDNTQDIPPTLIENTIPKNDILSTPSPRFSSSMRENTELCQSMRQILSTLMGHKYASHFNSPVNEKLDEFRDYSKFIKKPMDLSIVKSNLEKSHYVYIDEFIRDVQTVFNNSFMYHLESSPQVRMAKVLQDIFEKELDRALPYWRAFELSPKVETNDSFSDNDSESSIIAVMESYFISEESSRGATLEIISEKHETQVQKQVNVELEVNQNIPSENSTNLSLQIEKTTIVENSIITTHPMKEGSEKIVIDTKDPPKQELSTQNLTQFSENMTTTPLNRVDLEVDSLLGSESADSDTLSDFEEDATEIEDAEENQESTPQTKPIIVDFNRNIETAQKLLTASEMYTFFKSYIHPLLKSDDLQISMKASKERYENILERMQYSDRRDIIIEDTLPHSTSLLDVSILAEKVRYREDRLKLKEIQISNKCEIQEQIYKKKERELTDQKMKIEIELESKRLELSNKQIEFENKIAQIQQEVEALKQSLEQTKDHLNSRDSENENIQQENQSLKQSLEQANEQLGKKDSEIKALKSQKTSSNIITIVEKESKRVECDDFADKSVPFSTNSVKSTSSTMDNRDILEQNNHDEPLTEDESDVMSSINEVDYQLILEEDEQAKNAQKLDQTKQIQLQNDRCPCGREIWKDYGFMRKPRFCNYTNKYYCTKCHSNTCTEVIPAKILGYWEFKPYKVCDEASKYLKSVYRQPIICVSAVKPTLFDEIQNLGAARMIRKRLILQWEYVSRCPMKDNLIKQHNLQHRLHYLTDTEMYSIKNLEELNMKQVDSPFLQKLSKLFHILSEHIINQCGLCQTKAKSLCACCATGPIYDFNISQVIKCQSCKLVFHKGCFTNKKGVVACPICSVDD